MQKAIYKVTSKKTTEILEKELRRKNSYMPKILRKIKKLMPEVINVTVRDDPWDGKLKPGSLLFTPEHESTLDPKKWMNTGDVVVENKYRKTWWPKRNTKVGRELADTLTDLMPNEKFFQSDLILNSVGYKPKKQVEDVSANRITINTFRVGYQKKKGKMTFMFTGYTGYKPPRGVKEMLTSEYNRMMK